MNNSDKTVFVIGAGLAGIAASIRLRKLGFIVTVIEKNSTYGGKLDEFNEQGFRFDKGPSLFTSPESVDELFLLCDKNPRDYFNYKSHPVSCSYYFKDKSVLHFNTDKQKLKEELTVKLGTESAFKTLTYLERSKETYQKIGEFFIDRPQAGLKDIFRKELLIRYPHFLTSKLRKTLHQYNLTNLRNEKLIQIFDRYATYNGSSPFKMSGLYSMVPHLEQNTGTYFPEKGMRSIVDSLYKLAVEEGVEFRFEQNIQKLMKSDNGFNLVINGQLYNADKVVCAIDHLHFYRDILSDSKLFNYYSKYERSTSGFVFYWGIKKGIPEAGLHNIFFSENYKKEFEELFKEKKLPADPTIYLHVSSVVNKADAPEGAQNWFVMINTPAGYVPDSNEINQIRKKIAERLQMQFNIDVLSEIIFEKYWSAKQIESETGSVAGALYGASSNGKISALKRHGNRIKKIPGLYFCGGTVHPGGGIPLVLKSAKIVSELIGHER
ncbi:MAG: phytoene desaturase [Crocinitomicaceae bacterium]|nr:phytoene desaturase [Crocinitomicaceae bacterium]